MLIIGNFEHSIELEQALGDLEHNGILRSQIIVVLMDTHDNISSTFTNKSNDFHSKGIEVGLSFGTGFSVIGTSAGFILTWGPIIWGLVSAVIGFLTGFGLYVITNRHTHRHPQKKIPEVTVIVQCPENKSLFVMETFWRYRALTIGQAPDPSTS